MGDKAPESMIHFVRRPDRSVRVLATKRFRVRGWFLHDGNLGCQVSIFLLLLGTVGSRWFLFFVLSGFESSAFLFYVAFLLTVRTFLLRFITLLILSFPFPSVSK